MKVGDKARIIKKTFIHNGIIIQTKSIVEIVDLDSSVATVAYVDKEGGLHYIKLHPSELELEKENAC